MIAIEWLRRPGAALRGDRLAVSLAAATTQSAGLARTPRAICAALLPFDDPRRARHWRPATLGPLSVLFCGHLDNSAAIAAELGQANPGPGDAPGLAVLYAAALLRWGPRTDHVLIGEYAAIALNESGHHLRLSRSPLRAPPLHYYADAARVIAASVARAIFACGVEQQLDDDKLADMAWFNASNEAQSWFRGVNRVPLGSTVEFTPSSAQTRRYYDIGALQPLPRMSLADSVAQAQALLAEGTRAALAGSRRPAVMLSGGLDSSLVAVKALEAMPAETPLNAYTFVPEPGWGDYHVRGKFTDEGPLVAAFCQLHPRIISHFRDSAGRGLDTRLDDLFFAIGGAPQGLANLTPYHALWEAARADGCDRVLLGEFGNLTASADGSWAYSEYLITLRWRQLYRALRNAPEDDRSLVRRFLALAVGPFLSDALWDWQRERRGFNNLYHQASPLRRNFAKQSGALARSITARLPNPRYPRRDRLGEMKEVHANAWGEFSDIYAGFTQIHGLEQRDPTAYRPFFEFCAGLPSDRFLRDGQGRWLAREMLRGQLPEAQRVTNRTGLHGADWHIKLSRQREQLQREVEQFAKVPRLAAMLDLDRARAALENWPATGDVSDEQRLLCEVALPRTILTARFINYVEGRNLEV